MIENEERLRVLLTETESGAADRVARRLESAGHQVVRCHEAGASAFPCVGLADESGCPLEDTVDVAVTVRARPHPKPTAREDGVTCALRSHVPLVVSGNHAFNPFEEWTRVAADQDEVVEAAEWAARAPLVGPSRTATAETRRMLELLGYDAPDAEAVVQRAGGRLIVSLHLPDDVARRDANRVAVRVASELRRHFPHIGQVDVRVV